MTQPRLSGMYRVGKLAYAMEWMDMKFEYDNAQNEMVGFIDNAGDLCFEIGGTVIYITEDSAFEAEDTTLNDYAEFNGVKKAFYPGDKITITF